MLVDYKYKGDLTYNISNITYPYDYQFNYFFDISLLLVFLVFIFGFRQIFKYSNCVRIDERNENDLQERILSTTRDNNHIACNQNNVDTNNEHILPSYSEIGI